MAKEVLSQEQIDQIAHELSKDEARVSELRKSISALPLASKRVVKKAWKLKHKAERLPLFDLDARPVLATARVPKAGKRRA